MDSLLIEATNSTPEIRFLTTGELFIKGIALSEDSIQFFRPMFEWVINFTGPSINITFRFEYINTSSSKQIVKLLTHIKENAAVKNVLVNWYYEVGDDDNQEFGKQLQSVSMLNFEFYEYVESEKRY